MICKALGIGFLALALGACGPAAPDVSINMQPLAGGSQYAIWLFGQTVDCNVDAQAATARAALEALPSCGSQNPASSRCFAQKLLVTVGTTFYFSNLSPATWAVFGDEHDGSGNSIGWACGAATVKTGAAAEIDLTFQPD